jgi:heat shock protein HslJ
MEFRTFIKISVIPLILLLWLVTLMGCSSKSLASTNSSNDTPGLTAVPEPGWGGTYIGKLPCADCEGIETELILHSSTYQLSSTYLNKRTEPIKEYGAFTLNSKDSTIRMDNGRQFQMEKGKLYLLNLKGQRIEGALANHYILTQQKTSPLNLLEAELADGRWVLTQINGQPIHPDELTELPFLEFATTEKRIHGNASCNLFFGNYEIEDENMLVVKEINATKRYCKNMTVESQFLKTLTLRLKLQLKDDRLIFCNPENQEVAQFKKKPKQEK